MEQFCLDLPKIELHAHLTGSIRPETLKEIWRDMKQNDPGLDLGDPVEVLGKARLEMNAVKFFPLFSKYIYRLCNTATYIRQCTQAVLSDFAADGVTYLELRTIPRPTADLSAEDYVNLVLDTIDSQPSDQKPKSTYLILGVDREKDGRAEAQATVDLAIKLRSRGVVGIDLAGNPARNSTNAVLGIQDALERAVDSGLRLTLHFAELPASSSDEELKALLNCRPQRLGHVVRVPEWAKKEIIERKIGLELCLTCNVSAKLTDGGYADHHFGEWRKTHSPIAICTDDVGIFASPNSQEWLLLTSHFNLSKREAIDICRSGIECIFGTEEDKARLRRELDDFATVSGV